MKNPLAPILKTVQKGVNDVVVKTGEALNHLDEELEKTKTEAGVYKGHWPPEVEETRPVERAG